MYYILIDSEYGNMNLSEVIATFSVVFSQEQYLFGPKRGQFYIK